MCGGGRKGLVGCKKCFSSDCMISNSSPSKDLRQEREKKRGRGGRGGRKGGREEKKLESQ